MREKCGSVVITAADHRRRNAGNQVRNLQVAQEVRGSSKHVQEYAIGIDVLGALLNMRDKVAQKFLFLVLAATRTISDEDSVTVALFEMHGYSLEEVLHAFPE